ncbi:MAG: carbohydrate ABC transporter permease [Chloroflexi bacterium]|nr:MAG: glycerol-3-phosphate ABC transporter permease [Anaerolineaceae bacterium 4572_32.2]RLC78020.1 MAG: carbohydrate ABC transporter permease [Chloroflexota bacterium]RLC83237.1 MAG: carbohydrate ABC transporter permease [Chloroflexota bacterium]HEY73477.1 carbohydrate ABC transporter permease [Thermoflexia bacterium]
MTRKIRQDILTHVVLIAICILILSPVLFAISKSTQTRAEVFHYPPKLGPGTAFLDNYRTAWNTFDLGLYMKNSLIIALGVMVSKTIFSMLAGLALVYFDFPLKNPIFYFILFTLMMPTEIMIIALFNLVSDLGWGNNYLALIVPFMASATGVFLFRQHFSSISPHLMDAARVDGAGPLRFLWSVLIPMSWNTVSAMALIQFIYMWNQYIWPLVIIRENARQVVQIGLRSMTAVQDTTNWGVVMAGAVLAMLPPLAIFILLHEQFTRGFALGQEK